MNWNCGWFCLKHENPHTMLLGQMVPNGCRSTLYTYYLLVRNNCSIINERASSIFVSRMRKFQDQMFVYCLMLLCHG